MSQNQLQWKSTIEVRGVLNSSAKSIRKRICHVMAYACRLKFLQIKHF